MAERTLSENVPAKITCPICSGTSDEHTTKVDKNQGGKPYFRCSTHNATTNLNTMDSWDFMEENYLMDEQPSDGADGGESEGESPEVEQPGSEGEDESEDESGFTDDIAELLGGGDDE